MFFGSRPPFHAKSDAFFVIQCIVKMHPIRCAKAFSLMFSLPSLQTYPELIFPTPLLSRESALFCLKCFVMFSIEEMTQCTGLSLRRRFNPICCREKGFTRRCSVWKWFQGFPPVLPVSGAAWNMNDPNPNILFIKGLLSLPNLEHRVQ